MIKFFNFVYLLLLLRINKDTLAELQTLWKPAILITFTLILTGLVVGFLAVRLFGVDPLIALLGSAPGGTLGMSLVGAELGVGAAVAAIHATTDV